MKFKSTFGDNNHGVQIGAFLDQSGVFLEVVHTFLI